MTFFKKILYFLGGKPPEIIFKDGEVTHVHSDQKWQQWRDRFERNPDFQWKNHIGFRRKK